MYKIKKGLDLPITGQPEQVIQSSPQIKTAAILGPDYHGMKPTMKVKVGDQVKIGSPLFIDKKNEGVVHTSPVCGKVTHINRGFKRALESVVIAVSGSDYVQLDKLTPSSLENLGDTKAESFLVESGLWTRVRTRPYSRTPQIGSRPSSIFVNLMDSNPLAPETSVIMKGREEDFKNGLKLLSNLTKNIYCCSRPDQSSLVPNVAHVKSKTFEGPHPSGLAGTHIHFVDPVGKKKTVWTIHYQDVIAIGKTAISGRLANTRVISLAGPQVKKPCLMEVTTGASLEEVTSGRLLEGKNRVISGSVLSGHTASGGLAYLGMFHQQVSVLKEGLEREFLGWQKPGFNKFSVKNIFASKLSPGKKFSFTTSTEGSVRAMVPIGSYEKVMPLDVEPTFLLRSLMTGDTEQSQELGALELDEEDLGLCTYVCPTKEEYGPLLRDNLTRIEKDG